MNFLANILQPSWKCPLFCPAEVVEGFQSILQSFVTRDERHEVIVFLRSLAENAPLEWLDLPARLRCSSLFLVVLCLPVPLLAPGEKRH